MKIYDETQTSAEELLAEGVWNTLPFGLALIEDSVMVADSNVNHNFDNHSVIGKNESTGVGIIDNNHFVFVVVVGRSTGYSRGVPCLNLRKFFQT